MTDNDVTLPEVYRAIQALDKRCENAFTEFDRSQHALRNRQQNTDVKVAVLENRLETVEGAVAQAGETGRDWLARWSAIGAAIGSALAAAFAWGHK